MRRAHRAAVSQQRLTAAVALVAPWAILALSLLTNPAASRAYRQPFGRVIILAGAIATVLGHTLARRIASLSTPPRVFA